jgi:hypothetical protein
MSLIYQDDIGATIICNTGNTTIPNTCTVTLLVKKPGATPVSWSPTFDFATGIATYSTEDGDLDVSGEYRVQVQVVGPTPTTYFLLSDTDYFVVYEKLT